MSSYFKPSIVPPIPVYPVFGSVNPPYEFSIGQPYRDDMCDQGEGNRVMPENKLYAVPVFEKEGSVIDQLSVFDLLAVGAPQFIRIGIYADSNRLPSNLLFDSGLWNIGTAGIVSTMMHNLPFTIPATGTYWLVMIFPGGLSVNGVHIVTNAIPKLHRTLGTFVHHAGAQFGYEVMMALTAPYLNGNVDLPVLFPLSAIIPTTENIPYLWRRYSKIGD